MGIFSTDPESAAAKAAKKEADRQRREQERAEAERRRAEAEFWESPVGRARSSFQNGDQIFQITLLLQETHSIVYPMLDARTGSRWHESSSHLNGIAAEGWMLHSMSTAFVNEGEESRDRFLASGQQVAVRGVLLGTYAFTRSPANVAASGV